MFMGWNMYLSIAVLLVVTGLFTILGRFVKHFKVRNMFDKNETLFS